MLQPRTARGLTKARRVRTLCVAVAIAVGDDDTAIGGEVRYLSWAVSCEHTHALGKDVPERPEPTQGRRVKIGTAVDSLVERKRPTLS